MRELPEQLLNSLESLPHFDRDAFCEVHERGLRETSVRINPFKSAVLPFAGEPIPWCTEGLYLDSRPVFTLDPLFHAGCYYVQEPGSMFLAHALLSAAGDLSGKRVLDLCAAPGGKSTHLNALLGHSGLLVSNEITRNRVGALTQNLSKWGTANTVVTNSEPARFAGLPGCFDVLVIDAPCSGSGLFRKQPEAISEWSVSNVQMCQRRQKQILDDALPALKEGGLLFYSTCSYSPEENEKVVEWLVAAHEMEFVPVPVKPLWGLVDTGSGYRFYPDKTRSEGFFCALLRQRLTSGSLSFSRRRLKAAETDQTAAVARFLQASSVGELAEIQGRLHYLTPPAREFAELAADRLYLRKAGQYTGEMKGRDFVPAQDLAWSLFISADVPRLDLDETEALRYLRKGPVAPADNDRGIHLVTYQNFGLGWAKVLPGRVNNYLPNELRILM